MKSRSKLTLLALILAGEGIFFLPFVLARVFRPTFLKVFELTNLELGTAFSAYGIVAMLSYFFGGPLADRFQPSRLMAWALFLTSIGGFVLATIPNYFVFVTVYGFFGFTTIFLFWAGLIKATRIWGGEKYQGRAFGYLEGGRGASAALIGTLSVAIFSASSASVLVDDRTSSFQIVIIVTSIIVFGIGLFTWFTVPKVDLTGIRQKLPGVKEVVGVVKIPVVWMQGIIVVCAYVGYKATDDFSLYANEVLFFNEVDSAKIGTLALWLRPFLAIIAGILADRFSGTRVITFAFLVTMVCSLLIATGFLEGLVFVILIVLMASLVGVYAIRGIYFALMEDVDIPLKATGIAVGVISVIGFLPDVFMSPLMGWLLDNNPSPLGHRLVFLVLAIFSLVGLGTVVQLAKRIRKA
jgi:MFS family permease